MAIRYVAEHQQKLNSVHVFLGIDGRDGALGEDDKSDMAGGVEAEVVVVSNPDLGTGTGTGTEANLLVRIPSFGNANTNTTVSLALPTSVRPGPCDLGRVGDHWETKLVAIPVPAGNDLADHDVDIPVLLDAGRLSTIAPSSFACATCSSVVVSLDSPSASASAPDSPSAPPPPSPPLIYADLPSEHWEELIDAWMCHTDQALSDQVAKHTAHGFWPTPEKVLVGGSYLLFAQELVVRENLKAVGSIRVCVLLFLFPSFFISFLFFLPNPDEKKAAAG